MRMLVRITMDTAAGNAAIQNGTLDKLIGSTMEMLKPEAAYFYAHNGKRTGSFIFDLKSPSDIPPIAEPWFIGVNAGVEFIPVMNADDVKAGLQKDVFREVGRSAPSIARVADGELTLDHRRRILERGREAPRLVVLPCADIRLSARTAFVVAPFGESERRERFVFGSGVAPGTRQLALCDSEHVRGDQRTKAGAAIVRLCDLVAQVGAHRFQYLADGRPIV